MRHHLPLRAVALAVLLIASSALARVASANGASVTIVDFAYGPATVTISVGDTVTWTNLDAVEHTATSAAGAPQAFDTGLLAENESASVTFTTPGVYDYFCIPHPTMTGRVIVLDAPASQLPDAAMGTAGGPRPIDAVAAALAALLLLVVGSLVAAARRRRTTRA